LVHSSFLQLEVFPVFFFFALSRWSASRMNSTPVNPAVSVKCEPTAEEPTISHSNFLLNFTQVPVGHNAPDLSGVPHLQLPPPAFVDINRKRSLFEERNLEGLPEKRVRFANGTGEPTIKLEPATPLMEHQCNELLSQCQAFSSETHNQIQELPSFFFCQPAAESYVAAPQPYVAAPQPYVAAPQPYVAAPQPYVAAPQPYVAAAELDVAAPQPYVAAAELDVAAPQSYVDAAESEVAAAQRCGTVSSSQTPVQNDVLMTSLLQLINEVHKQQQVQVQKQVQLEVRSRDQPVVTTQTDNGDVTTESDDNGQILFRTTLSVGKKAFAELKKSKTPERRLQQYRASAEKKRARSRRDSQIVQKLVELHPAVTVYMASSTSPETRQLATDLMALIEEAKRAPSGSETSVL